MSIDHQPDFNRLRTAITCRGIPDRVPFADVSVYAGHKARVLGHPARGVDDEVAFARAVGYDFIPFGTGFHLTPALTGAMADRHYAVGASGAGAPDETVERRWAAGKSSRIATDADFEAFVWPDPDALDYSFLDEADRRLPANMKVICVIGKVFNPVWWLTGFETFAMLLVDNPGLVERLFEQVGRFQLRVLERCLAHRSVGAHWHADDVAFNTGVVVSPRVLRRYAFPWFRKMVELAHQAGALAIYHSDGKLDAVIDDILGLGFDGLNPIDPMCMDIVALKQRVQGRLGLLGNIDLRYTLTLGTPEEVEAEVKDRLAALAPGGGYVLSSANSVPDYVPFENYMAMRDAWLKYGRY
jgi:uroporphyrinogen decarboxylase